MSDNTTNRNGTSSNSGPSSRSLATSSRLSKVIRPTKSDAPEVEGGREHGETDTTANLPDYPDFESLLAASSGGPGA